MIRADFLEAFRHDSLGQLRVIAFAAQVGQVKMTEVSGHYFLRGIGGSFIGEMSMATENALLETPRTVGAILQHFDVVIGFQHEDIGGADAIEDLACRVSEIREKADVNIWCSQQEAHGIRRVVRNVERFHADISDLETVAGREDVAIEFRPQLILNGLVGGAVAINRQAQFCRQYAETLNVIAVFVSDDDAGQVFRHATDRGQALADLARAEPGIDENTGLVGLHISAVSGGTASKNRQVNRHG